MSRCNDQKRKNLLIWKSINLSFAKINSLLSATTFCLVHPWPKTLQKPWTNWLAPTMWTLASVKTDLDDFLGPKRIPTADIKLRVFMREDKNAEI